MLWASRVCHLQAPGPPCFSVWRCLLCYGQNDWELDTVVSQEGHQRVPSLRIRTRYGNVQRITRPLLTAALIVP